ncbi:MAG: glycosyltransferase family 2 protein [Gemmatimonadetes bacterium]|nr:glycosyltransferase family 2 protein [Gemmatimonadota bacterium]
MRQPVGVAPPAQLRISPDLRRNFAVVIPAYDEAANIPELLGVVAETFRRYDLAGEVIVVDDGSTDRTAEIAEREGARLERFRVLRHRANLGKTEALLSGAAVADSDWIVLYDADLQHSPEEIPRFLAKLTEGYDIVCGRKVGAYEKRWVSGIYNRLSRTIFRVPVGDLNSMKIFRKSILDEIQLRHDWHRFFVVLAHARGYRVGEIDIVLHPRRHGRPKYRGGGRILIGILDLVSVWFQLFFSRKPMLLFGVPGLTLFALGGLVGIAAVIMRLFGHGFRPMLDLVVLLVVVGVSLFCFGFLGEMLASLRAEVDELKRRIAPERGSRT